MKLLDRFLRYVSIDTTSDPRSESYPSSEKQFTLLKMLVGELRDLGLDDAAIDAHGYVTATIPATEGCEHSPVIGFIAHVDTSPDMSGEGVNPQIIEDYDGGEIRLGTSSRVLRPAEFPELAFFRGHTLITTDGTTLLGADDKAGIAEIMTAAEELLVGAVPHGPIRIGFTPDEEIGRGVYHFDVEAFGAKFAYTVDGGMEGELEYENFNAAGAKLTVAGRNIHPGYAKDKIINALHVIGEFDAMLPAWERPEHTAGYEGFYHLTDINGTVDHAVANYIVRDHSRASFERRKAVMERAAASLRERHGDDAVKLEVADQYYNMREMVEPYPEVIEKAKQAMLLAGVTPLVRPIRGGTDGARLSYMGLPCPNLFAGGMNFHGRYEYCSLDTMRRAVKTIVNLAALWAKGAGTLK
jgi:tripeptide aminopeptidase